MAEGELQNRQASPYSYCGPLHGNTVSCLRWKMITRDLIILFLNKDSNTVQFLPEAFRNGYIAVVIGARHFTKQLPVSKLTSLCSLIREPVVLLGGEEDYANGETIVRQGTG